MTADLKTALLALALAAASTARAHDVITTSITFNKEIIRILNGRCNGCHAAGGSAFSLSTYKEARPWAQAIKEEILSRRMPPWGAVKGFGEFRNDQALSNEQIETILGWIDGGVPEGEASSLPGSTVPAPKEPAPAKPTIFVSERGTVLVRALRLDGIQPLVVPVGASMKIVATLPDGTVEPLVWLDNYQAKFAHPFLLETPLNLPAGARIDGLAPGARIGLLPKRK
jgi:hypothetical protein